MKTTVRERPILFSAPMVLALLEGRKTQTRRICKQLGCSGCNHPGNIIVAWNEHGRCSRCDGTRHEPPESCPYGGPGDKLWVRETFAYGADVNEPDTGPFYRATDPGWDDNNTGLRWRSPIHTPRWASRLTTEIVDVRVQRLQDISEEDARAEGWDGGAPWANARSWYIALWDSINGPGSWASNPWVWAITFKTIAAKELMQ